MKTGKEASERLETIRTGGAAKYHEKGGAAGKLFCRDRLARLLDEGSFLEDATFARPSRHATTIATNVPTNTAENTAAPPPSATDWSWPL